MTLYSTTLDRLSIPRTKTILNLSLFLASTTGPGAEWDLVFAERISECANIYKHLCTARKFTQYYKQSVLIWPNQSHLVKYTSLTIMGGKSSINHSFSTQGISVS